GPNRRVPLRATFGVTARNENTAPLLRVLSVSMGRAAAARMPFESVTTGAGRHLRFGLSRVLLQLAITPRGVQCVALMTGIGPEHRARHRSTGGTQLVHLLRHRRTLVLERKRVTVLVHPAERLVHLDELTMR